MTTRHEVVIFPRPESGWSARQRWQAYCRGCGAESYPSTHKPTVEGWRKQHYAEAKP